MFGSGGGTVGRGVAFLIGAATVAEFIAKDVSSPQTVHLNASKRAPTLMKWVHVGQVEAAVFVVIAAIIDPTFAVAFLAGGAMEMIVTEAEYLHARNTGMAEGGATTETYSDGGGW